MFSSLGLRAFGRAAVCVGAAGAAARLFHLLRLSRNKQDVDCIQVKQSAKELLKQAGCKATDSNLQHDVHSQPPKRRQQHYQHQQQRALAAAQELDQLALAASEFTASLRLEGESVAALQKQQLALQQRMDDLAGVARLSLQTLDQPRASLDSSSGGSWGCADGSCSASTGSSWPSSVRPIGSWFTRAVGMADGSGKQAMLLELQDLMQQSRADEVEFEAVRTELLALTDGRIHEETALRDELARRVAVLEDELQQEGKLAEDDQAYISSLQAYISQLSFTAA